VPLKQNGTNKAEESNTRDSGLKYCKQRQCQAGKKDPKGFIAIASEARGDTGSGNVFKRRNVAWGPSQK
jgi:hypothetical protein